MKDSSPWPRPARTSKVEREKEALTRPWLKLDGCVDCLGYMAVGLLTLNPRIPPSFRFSVGAKIALKLAGDIVKG
jgi:hypothetical protein